MFGSKQKQNKQKLKIKDFCEPAVSLFIFFVNLLLSATTSKTLDVQDKVVPSLTFCTHRLFDVGHARCVLTPRGTLGMRSKRP